MASSCGLLFFLEVLWVVGSILKKGVFLKPPAIFEQSNNRRSLDRGGWVWGVLHEVAKSGHIFFCPFKSVVCTRVDIVLSLYCLEVPRPGEIKQLKLSFTMLMP